jgi:hypothetical protein
VLEFGTVVWVKVKGAGKLDPQAVEGHFVGYDDESKGYRIFFTRRHTVIVERDVYFDKGAVVDVGEVAFEGETEIDSAKPSFRTRDLPKLPRQHPKTLPIPKLHTYLLKLLPTQLLTRTSQDHAEIRLKASRSTTRTNMGVESRDASPELMRRLSSLTRMVDSR